MRRGIGKWRLLAAWGLVACGGASDPVGAPVGPGKASGTAPGGAARPDDAAPEPDLSAVPPRPIAFETRTFKFEVVRPEDQRHLVLEADVPVPHGWGTDPKTAASPVLTTLVAPGGTPPVSSVTIAATCFGTCTAVQAESNLAAAVRLQADASPGARVVRDEALTPPLGVDGVPGARMRGFVLETADHGARVGVALQPEVETGFILACQAALQPAYANQTQAVFDACAKMKVRVLDPTLPIADLRTERENLAKCPRAATLTYSVKAPSGAEPTHMADPQTVLAVSTRAGLIELYLGDYAFTSVRAEAAPKGPDEHRVRIGFDAGTLGGEVLSGTLPAMHGPVRIEASLTAAGGVYPLASDALEGQVELVARTRTHVCGKFKLADAARTIEGEFPATPIRIGSAP